MEIAGCPIHFNKCPIDVNVCPIEFRWFPTQPNGFQINFNSFPIEFNGFPIEFNQALIELNWFPSTFNWFPVELKGCPIISNDFWYVECNGLPSIIEGIINGLPLEVFRYPVQSDRFTADFNWFLIESNRCPLQLIELQ